MISGSDLFQYGLLAEASYAFLGNKNEALEKNSLSSALKTEDSGPGGDPWPASLADDFVKHWRVISHRPNTESGFSATLYERLNSAGQPTGQFVLAPRGTEPLATYLADLQADVGDIVGEGLAWRQVVDLFNYWNEISTPNFRNALRARVIAISPAEAAKRILQGETGIVIESPLAASRIVLEDSGSRGRGLVSAGSVVDVAGHSLGGHLATAFSRLFPNSTGDVFTVNGAGYRSNGATLGNVDRVFPALGGMPGFDAGKILNVYGEAGAEIVTQDIFLGLTQPGSTKGIYIEDAIGHTAGHGSDQMSDALAVYDLYLRLDTSLSALTATEAITKIRPWIDAASARSVDTFEASINAIRKSLGFSPIPNTGVDDREGLYGALFSLENSDTFKALAGKLTLTGSDAACADFGQFLALVHLTPFALKATDATALAVLKSANQTLAHAWEADAALSASPWLSQCDRSANDFCIRTAA